MKAWCVHWPQQVPECLTVSTSASDGRSLSSDSRINLRSEGNTSLSLNHRVWHSLWCVMEAQVTDYRLQITDYMEKDRFIFNQRQICPESELCSLCAGERRVSYLASLSVDVFLSLILKLRLLSSVGGASAMNDRQVQDAVRWVLEVESLHVYIHLLLTCCSATCWWFIHSYFISIIKVRYSLFHINFIYIIILFLNKNFMRSLLFCFLFLYFIIQTSHFIQKFFFYFTIIYLTHNLSLMLNSNNHIRYKLHDATHEIMFYFVESELWIKVLIIINYFILNSQH